MKAFLKHSYKGRPDHYLGPVVSLQRAPTLLGVCYLFFQVMSQGDNSLQPTLLGKCWTKINLGCVTASRLPFLGEQILREAGLDLDAQLQKEGAFWKMAPCQRHQKGLQAAWQVLIQRSDTGFQLLQHKKVLREVEWDPDSRNPHGKWARVKVWTQQPAPLVHSFTCSLSLQSPCVTGL